MDPIAPVTYEGIWIWFFSLLVVAAVVTSVGYVWITQRKRSLKSDDLENLRYLRVRSSRLSKQDQAGQEEKQDLPPTKKAG